MPSADSGFRSGLALSQVSDQGSPVDRGFSRPSALVSVVLTTLRVDDWLDQAVKSILEQTHVDLQVVVVHDGVSPDPARRWMDDPRVMVVCHASKRGVSAAANSGLAVARHDLVARLDADDLSLPERLVKQADKMGKEPDLVALGCAATHIDENGRVLASVGGARCEDLRRPLLTRNQLVHSSVMYRRSVVIALGGYDEGLDQMEDYELWLRLARLGRLARMPEQLVSYRHHASQTSRGARTRGIYISRIVEARLALARSLGVSPRMQMARNAAWVLAQYRRRLHNRRWRCPGMWPNG